MAPVTAKRRWLGPSDEEDEPTEKTALLSKDDGGKAGSKDGDNESLATGPVVDIYNWANCGYLLQYYAVGLIYGGLPATIYGFFVGYLNVRAS